MHLRNIAAVIGLFASAAAAHAAPPPHPLLFVTQVPTGYDFVNMTLSAPFANHLPTTLAAPRGGDLVLLGTNGSLRYLTAEAGLGSAGGGTLLTGNRPSPCATRPWRTTRAKQSSAWWSERQRPLAARRITRGSCTRSRT